MADHDQARRKAVDERAEVEALLELPPRAHIKNINYDTHSGAAPQRPYADVEDRMAAFTRGFASFEDLAAALPKGQKIRQREDGAWVRTVPKHTGNSFVVDGVLHHEVEDVERHVALTKEAAQAASASGTQTDFWNGFTWLRRGTKPEMDVPVMRAAPQAERRNLRLERAGPTDQAIAKATQARADALRPPVPEAPSKAAVAGKEKD